jgi:CRISPR/Cas system-associated exonuclease Cas4 (RecB family)
MSDMVKEAIAEHFGVSADEVTEANAGRCDGHYGLPVYEVDGKEVAVGTEDEVQTAAYAYIKDTLWAFNAEFIGEYCNLNARAIVSLRKMQEELCEDANDLIEAMIEGKGSVEDFADRAISADGRGQMLSPYDGREIDLGDFYAYRVN